MSETDFNHQPQVAAPINLVPEVWLCPTSLAAFSLELGRFRLLPGKCHRDHGSIRATDSFCPSSLQFTRGHSKAAHEQRL